MDRKALKVLLVEDNDDDIVFLRRILNHSELAQFQLETEHTLKGALSRIEGENFDLLLLDLSLPDSKGLDTFFAAQQKTKDLPIIVLSGLDDETIAIKAVHAGAQDYLAKGKVDGQLLSRAIVYAIERTQSRLALLGAEEKFRSIFENAVEGIFQTTPEGRYLSANPALTKIYGYDSTSELMGGLTDISRMLYVEPYKRAEFIRLMQEHDVVTGFESRVYRKDRSIIWISENVRSVRDKHGKLLYYEGTVENITERKYAQERLRHSEELYHSLVETLPQNIFRKDLSERFTFANKRFCETMGRTHDEILGRTDFDFFPEEMARKYQKDDRTIMEQGKSLEVIEEHRPPGGEVIYVQTVKTPIYADGKIIGLQGIFWDITERKRADERVRKANEELAKSQEELRKKNETMEADLKMAHEIQQAILPQAFPVFPKGVSSKESKLQFCHRYFPTGEVGGDFFNVSALSDSKAGIFVCDVMGHGVRSALVTALVRGLVEELRSVAEDPGKMLSSINRDLRAILQQTGTPLFTTAFYLLADVEAKKYYYANAGHPKPFVYRMETGEVVVFSNTSGKPCPALGLFPESIYSTSEAEMKPGDIVLLYTDGLYEVEGAAEAQFSPELLKDVVSKHGSAGCPEVLDLVLGEIRNFSVEKSFSDDVCLIGMQVGEV
ncbi:MAG: putative sensor protein [Verrucomicrobiales bacterium]|nr:putative sensor protein [Verrucomicrobiales bacterium]